VQDIFDRSRTPFSPDSAHSADAATFKSAHGPPLRRFDIWILNPIMGPVHLMFPVE